MGLFGNRNKVTKGSIADVISCPKRDYLVWKWAPNGETSDNLRADSIRYGSMLTVEPGETAVFFYNQKDGRAVEYIKGPVRNMPIETSNLPVLSTIIGSAYGGGSPFSASVYFINTSAANEFPFFIGNCEVVDKDSALSVPANVKGSVVFAIDDCEHFFNIHRFKDMDMADLQSVVKNTVISALRPIVETAPENLGVDIFKLQSRSTAICDMANSLLERRLYDLAGVKFRSLNIESIALDKTHENYERLQSYNEEIANIKQKQLEVQRRQIEDMYNINIQNIDESLQIQRDTTRLAGQGANLAAHQINVQGDVAYRAAESLGELGANGGAVIGGGNDNNGGINMAGLMAGMMVGGAVGTNMGNMMNNMTANISGQVNTPPPPPPTAVPQYHVVLNGQQMGPYPIAQLQGLVATGQLTRNTYVWKAGMNAWDIAGNVVELAQLFNSTPPPMPPMPPTL